MLWGRARVQAQPRVDHLQGLGGQPGPHRLQLGPVPQDPGPPELPVALAGHGRRVGRTGPGGTAAGVGQRPAPAAGLMLGDAPLVLADRRRPAEPSPPAGRGRRDEELVVHRPGDPHPRVEPLHRPAGGDQLLVQQQVVVGPEPVDQPVGHHPVAVVLVAGQQVGPALVADRAPVVQDQLAVATRRVGEVHLEAALDLDRGEAVDPGRPLEVAAQQRLARGQGVGARGRLAAQGPGEPLEDQRQHHRALPVPHAGEVVDGQGVTHGQVQVEGGRRPGRLEALALPGPEVPLPAAALERSPVGRCEAVGHVR